MQKRLPHLLITTLLLGNICCLIFKFELWPFSNYPMYSAPVRTYSGFTYEWQLKSLHRGPDGTKVEHPVEFNALLPMNIVTAKRKLNRCWLDYQLNNQLSPRYNPPLQKKQRDDLTRQCIEAKLNSYVNYFNNHQSNTEKSQDLLWSGIKANLLKISLDNLNSVENTNEKPIAQFEVFN